MQSERTKADNKRRKQDMERLLARYRGLKENDLDPINPTFSCVLCGYYTCRHHNIPRQGCLSQRPIQESEWLKFYNLF